LNKTVLGYFNEDESISWCFYYDGDMKKLKRRLLKHFTDADEVKRMLKHDIQEILPCGEYIKHENLKSQKPFSSKNKMLSNLKDEVKKIFVFDDIDGWLSISLNGKEKELKSSREL
jgi:hypothetical protein